MRIVFHGANAAAFSGGFAELLGEPCEIALLPDGLATEADRRAFAAADVIIGIKFDGTLPRPLGLRLYHLPAAGYDGIDFAALPGGAVVCNCFGHEQAISEYVMAALLQRTVPLADADRRLRKGDWAYWAGSPERVHPELFGSTIGILGFGHIGRTVAGLAKAFGMRVHVANRSPVAVSALVDRYLPLESLVEMCGEVDTLVVTVPLLPETRGMVGAAALGAMRRDAHIINVARGPVIDEQALFEALRDQRIGGATIDTWYRYPSADDAGPMPGTLPFETLPTVVMTPHMSGWTSGTIRRRQATMAENIRRRWAGETCENVVG
jgi:phosphoglycerate dehydrogenase-like enzyme